MKIDAMSFGLAGGIICAVLAFLLALGAAFGGWGAGMVEALSSMYFGYKAGFVGGLIGAISALIEGFICFYALAWVYDKLNREKSA